MRNINGRKSRTAFALISTSFLLLAACIFSKCSLFNRPDRGNSVTIRLTAEPEKLNPLLSEDGNTVQVTANIFMALLDFDAKTLELVPLLAKNRPIVSVIDTGANKGGVTYTYQIRDEAAWDNGTPVTAADYIFTIKAVMNKQSGANNFRSGLDFIRDITVDAKNPKKFTIIADKAYILSETNSGTVPILPEYIYDAGGLLKKYSVAELSKSMRDTSSVKGELAQFATQFQSPKFSRDSSGVNGCGAYTLDEWTDGQKLVLKKKKNWWGDRTSQKIPILTNLPEKIIFKPVKDEVAVLSLLKNQELDVASKISPKAFLELQKNDSTKENYAFLNPPAFSIAYIGINTKDPKLADKRVRRALTYLADPQTYITKIMNGFAEPCAGPFVPQRPYYNKNVDAVSTNIERAKTLLKDAGWINTNGDSTVDKDVAGKKTELVLRYVYASQNVLAKNIGLLFQENAKKAGVGVILQGLDDKVVKENLKKRDFDMFLSSSGFAPGLDDPKEIWSLSSNTPDGANRFQFGDAHSEALIQQIRSELNPEKRNQLYADFQKLIGDEAPAIFLFEPKERLLIHKRFIPETTAKRPGYVLGLFRLSTK